MDGPSIPQGLVVERKQRLSTTLRVLVVDDDRNVCLALAGLLENLHCDVSMVHDGAVVIEEARTLQPDLILLDLFLPNRSGLEVCHDLRADALLQDTAVFVITGETEVASRRACFEAGADDLLYKPLNPDELKMRVRNLNRRKNVETELHRIRAELELRVEERTRALQQANRRLTQAQRMEALGTLAGGIAHDFNNILSPIVGYAEMLLEDLDDDENAENVGYILSAANRAKDLVQQILTFSRQKESGTTKLEVHLVVAEATRLLRASLPATIELRHKIDKKCGMVRADPVQIHQVVMNLCTNAFQAMTPQGGTLTIGLREVRIEQEDIVETPGAATGPHVEISVSDTGRGIPQEHIDRVFEPYFTTQEPGRGSGLGLAVVHGIVTSCNGHVELRSRLDRGTTVFVRIPRAPDVKSIEIPTLFLGAKDSLRVMLVDDEPLLLKVASSMLGRGGHQVVTRLDPGHALVDFESAPEDFDLVILDHSMPGMTGIELGGRMLAIRPEIPLILCTGYSEQIDENTVRDLGFAGYLRKPFGKQELHAVIAKVSK